MAYTIETRTEAGWGQDYAQTLDAAIRVETVEEAEEILENLVALYERNDGPQNRTDYRIVETDDSHA